MTITDQINEQVKSLRDEVKNLADSIKKLNVDDLRTQATDLANDLSSARAHEQNQAVEVPGQEQIAAAAQHQPRQRRQRRIGQGRFQLAGLIHAHV